MVSRELGIKNNILTEKEKKEHPYAEAVRSPDEDFLNINFTKNNQFSLLFAWFI